MEERGSIAWEVVDGAGWIYFNRPERLNALQPGSARDLWACLNALESRGEVRAVVFTGRGNAFCAGMELSELEGATPLAARRRAREAQMITDGIAGLARATSAAVNGVAMGLGLEICLACDLALATPGARFAFPEVRLGMIPSGGGTQRLARLVGLRRAREMLLAGRVVDAETAAAWGLVNQVVGEEELVSRVREWVEKVSQGGGRPSTWPSAA
jgi:enoyl-CoA hydratase/carnithine racemase